MKLHKEKERNKKLMKQLLCFTLGLLLALYNPVITAYAKPEWPEDTGIESESGIVMDMDSGAVLYGQGIHVQKAPASITKLLTALVVIENSKLDDIVTFSNDAVYNVEEASGNKLALDEGDKLSVEDCLYVLLLQSSNQAANALAEHVAGDRSAFVDMMNKKVEELGCRNSVFANPSGLNDEKQLTTAYDMALIGTAAYNNPKLLEIGSSKSHKIPPTKNNPNGVTFSMEHKLLMTTDPNNENYYPSAVAGKTGYTTIAGQTLVTYAKKDDRRLIAVTLKSSNRTHYSDTIALLNFGFDRFKNVKIAENEISYTSGAEAVSIGGISYEPSDLSMDSEAVITIPKNAAFTDVVKTVETTLPKSHPQGAAALLSYKYGERPIGQVYLISAKKSAEEAAAVIGTDGSYGESGGDNEGESGKESTAAVHKEGKAPKTALKISPKLILIIAGIAIAATLSGGGLLFLKKKKEEERQLLEERRMRRRQRLEEIGCSEEEFKRMLESRNQKKIKTN